MPSTFIQNLHESFQVSPLSKKVLLATRFADGQQWLHQVCKAHGQVLNVEVQTIESLALKQAALKLYQNNYMYIRSGQSIWIVQQIMMELAKEGNTYMPEALLTPGMVSCFHRSIEDLRQSLVSAKELKPAQFVDQRKGEYLKEVLLRYEEKLRKHNFKDLMLLAELVEADADVTMFIMPEENVLTNAQKAIIQSIAVDRLSKVERGLPFTSLESGFPVSSAEFFHTTGTIAEVREVMRRALSRDVQLDQIEVITSNYDAYAGAFHMIASDLAIPCTYSNGLPIQHARTGRTLLKMLHWVESDFPIADFIALLREGRLSFRNVNESIRSSEWIRTLEGLNIGWGMERYLLLLDPKKGTDEEKTLLDHLNKVFTSLFSVLPTASEWSPAFIMKWLQQVVKKYGTIQDEDDAIIVKELDDIVDSLSIEGLSSSLMQKEVALQYVKQLLAGIRVKANSIPSPGAIHVSSLSNGGLSGRPHTFIVGMDEHNWSITSRQDPVLLDEERQNISAELMLSTDRSKQIKKDQYTRLSLISGHVTLSHSSYQLSEGKQASPAFELLQIFRNQQQLPDADYTDLQEALGAPVSYLAGTVVTKNQSSLLDVSDVWAEELTDEFDRMKNGRAAMETVYAFTSKGKNAVQQRFSNLITEYDGYVQVEGLAAEIQKRAFSASQLERYAECPMKFYFGYVLGIWAKDESVYDRTRWLDPADRGNLLHRVFYDYLKQTTLDGKQVAIHNKTVLDAITEGMLEQYKQLIPAPSLHILRKESADIRADVEWFYHEEVAKTTRPRYFEQELILNGEPMQVKLTDGSFITLKGFIDRIDQTGPNEYRIIDYKTGSPSKYRENEYFAGGTQLQHALYALAAEQWLRDTGIDKEAQVTESAYYFPTGRGIGREVVRLQNKRSELTQVVRNLLTSMEQGIYIPTHETKRCRYCDYAAVCGNHAGYMEDKKVNSDNAVLLKELLEVESID